MTATIRFVFALTLALVPLQSALGKDSLLMAGGEVSETDFYSYLGVMLPGPGYENGRGFIQRYWPDRFGYEYEGAAGEVDAKVWGGEAAVGYVIPTRSGWWSTSVGLRFTDTELSPDDRSASARGKQFSPKVQLEGDTEIAQKWRLGAIGSYTIEQSQYWGRIRLLRRMASEWSVGAEAIANGNDEMDSIAAGTVLIWQPDSQRWSLAFKAGYRFQDGYDGTFGGLEIGHPF